MNRLLARCRGGMDNRGAAAVEFAIVFALFLLPLFIGMIEITTLLRAQGKLNAVANDVALMVSIETSTSVTNGVYSVPATGTGGTSLQDICNGAVAGYAPYPANGMTVQIASVTEQAASNGVPATNTSNSFVHNGTSVYDDWEQDFVVSNGSCSPVTTSGIGASGASNNAINLTTSNPPSTIGGGTGGVVQYPCDNGIIVKASVSYPGILGMFISNRTVLSQAAYERWRYASTTSELRCSGCTVSYNNTVTLYGSGSSAVTQSCNTSDTAAQN